MRRAFAIDVLACARCGGRMRVIGTVKDARDVRWRRSRFDNFEGPLPFHHSVDSDLNTPSSEVAAGRIRYGPVEVHLEVEPFRQGNWGKVVCQRHPPSRITAGVKETALHFVTATGFKALQDDQRDDSGILGTRKRGAVSTPVIYCRDSVAL
jgi:hypothetical protein